MITKGTKELEVSEILECQREKNIGRRGLYRGSLRGL